MFALMIVLITLCALFIILVVLLQAGKGGGLAAEFGGASSSTDSIMGGRQAATFLTRASWISGGVFMALAMVLAIMSSRAAAPPSSILRSEFQSPTGAPESVLESEGAAPSPILDEAGDPATGAGGADEAPVEGDEQAP